MYWPSGCPSCVTSVTVNKSGFGIWFIDENSVGWNLNCKNAASSSLVKPLI